MACNYRFPMRTIKFRIWKERHVQMRKPYQSPGSDEKLILIASVGDRTHDLLHTVASNMVKVSHTLNHSATEAKKNAIMVCLR